jgi:hypothetical protein
VAASALDAGASWFAAYANNATQHETWMLKTKEIAKAITRNGFDMPFILDSSYECSKR